LTSADEDFASAAMMRLVAMGLANQGISVPMAAPTGAHVRRGTKRDLLDRVLQDHGLKAILAISDAVPQMPPEPVVLVLRKAVSLADLLDRWARLETFSHGRHRVDTVQVSPGSFQLHHVARDNGPPPSAVESLLVFGLITRLCEDLGAEPVTLKDEGGNFWRQDGVWSEHVLNQSVGRATLSARFPDRLDDFSKTDHQDPNALRQAIAEDPLRRWTLKSLAQHAATSERTLQRRMASQSTSFSRILFEARLQIAADHLCAEDGPGLAEIGFLSGYADQAHFARSFKQGVGTTPKKYREAFQQKS